MVPASRPRSGASFRASRRAERETITLSREEEIGGLVLPYLSRLSDALFVIARYENHESGVDEPLWKQFVVWIASLAQGDLGQSMFWNESVMTLVAQRAEPTIALAATTLAVALLVAISLGVLLAIGGFRRWRTRHDRV